MLPVKCIQILLLCFITVIAGCGTDKKSYPDTPTAGEITIVADESYEPMIQVQIDTFMDIYKYAKINVRYLPEAEVFNALLNNDSFRIAIVSRNLDEGEVSHFEKQKIIPRSLKIAEDAIALIVNSENKDTLISYEQLGEIVKGKIISWKQINPKSTGDSIRIVFDRNGSSNSRFLRDRFLSGQSFSSNVYATNSNASVVDYVSTNKNAIGVISVNWISDKDDSLAGGFLEKIKVVSLSMPDTSTIKSDYNKPYQAYIALKTYPLTRDIIIVNREGRNGLGTGFASFVAGDKGQRMIRLMGLLPATMPVRIINVN